MVWIARCWNSLLPSPNPKNNLCLSRIFGARFGGKDRGLVTCKPWSKQEGGWIHFCMKQLRTLNSYQILNIKNKKIKIPKRLMSFSRPIQWYHSHADPIWPGGTFKVLFVRKIQHWMAKLASPCAILKFERANFKICIWALFCIKWRNQRTIKERKQRHVQYHYFPAILIWLDGFLIASYNPNDATKLWSWSGLEYLH